MSTATPSQMSVKPLSTVRTPPLKSLQLYPSAMIDPLIWQGCDERSTPGEGAWGRQGLYYAEDTYAVGEHIALESITRVVQRTQV